MEQSRNIPIFNIPGTAYLWNNQGIFLYLIFLEHYFGILPGVSLGIFFEYTWNISWEYFTNIP